MSKHRLHLVETLIHTSLLFKDNNTAKHSANVARYAERIGFVLGLPPADQNNLRLAGLIHDVGKLFVPKKILNKPGPLSAKERDIINRHPATGYIVARTFRLPPEICSAILSHHEKLDGSGYPGRLFKSELTLLSQIITVADVYDAMTSDRPYRPALSPWDAVQILINQDQFNQDVVKALVDSLNAQNRKESASYHPRNSRALSTIWA